MAEVTWTVTIGMFSHGWYTTRVRFVIDKFSKEINLLDPRHTCHEGCHFSHKFKSQLKANTRTYKLPALNLAAQISRKRARANNFFLSLGQTIATYQRNISQHCWSSICKLRLNDRNISAQHIAALLGATCCARLATLLRHVATCWVLLAQI